MASGRTKQGDDDVTETRGEKRPLRFRDRVPLPSAVANALGPTKSTGKPGSSWGSRALALVPLLVMVTFVALMFPRATPPGEVPLPLVDERELAKVEESDRALAATARRGLGDDTRVLGSAIRSYFALHEAEVNSPDDVAKRRTELDRAAGVVARTAPHEIKLLRAAQLEVFQAALAEYELTGVASSDLHEVGGGFVRRMKDVGWTNGTKILADHTVRAVLFKIVWNGTVGVGSDPVLAPSLDELRALHAFYIRHPHVPEQRKQVFDEARRSAPSKAACEELDGLEAAAIEDFRLEKIKRLGALDPDYPTTYAIGIASYRRGRYGLAAESFRDWLRAHPSGPLTFRAQNYLKASIAADIR